MTDWADAAVAHLTLLMEEAADPDKAAGMTKYMRDQYPFMGIMSPVARKMQSVIVETHGKPQRADVLDYAEQCWELPEREFQYAGQKVLRRYIKLLESGDLGRVRVLIETKSWWDTVDELANHVVGGLVAADSGLQAEMDEWIEDDNMWVARTALLHQLRYKDDTDADRLFSYCRRQMGHPDFFIRKAIGWALRQYGRTDGPAVVAFVKANEDGLSGLSKREALKHLG